MERTKECGHRDTAEGRLKAECLWMFEQRRRQRSQLTLKIKTLSTSHGHESCYPPVALDVIPIVYAYVPSAS